MTFRGKLGSRPLGTLHPAPADEAVDVVDEKHDETDYDRNVRKVVNGGEHPQNYENDVVCGICQRKAGAAAEGQPHGDKACGDRDCAWDHVRRAECFKDEPERRRHRGGDGEHEEPLL